jgi:hypothetical protein
MTKDELVELAERAICDAMKPRENGAIYAEDAARAVVELLMPPPLVWKEVDKQNPGELVTDCGFCAEDYTTLGWRLSRDYTKLMGFFPTLEAAQAAAQAHADAAWIAQTRAAQP